jgi:two-component system sensor histidine kinase LytS
LGLAHLFSTQIELEDIEQQARLLDRAEIRALQAQINPHFLFNALNTIVSFCRTDSEKARELLIHLGNFHRSSLKRGESGLISLEEELDNVRAYLMIEKARFGHRIQVSYRLNHGEGKWHIPQFTLQPLVENAVKHGLAMSDRNGLITIETAELDGDLQIMIEDNGAGMPDAERTNILSDRGESQTGAGIALSNINQRLQLLYGPEYGRMRIESKEGSGTKIYLRIPGNPIINNS